MTTADGVEITPEMDLFSEEGMRLEPHAENFAEANPGLWRWVADFGTFTTEFWPQHCEGPLYASPRAAAMGLVARKRRQANLVADIAERLVRKGSGQEAAMLSVLASDLRREAETIECEAETWEG